MTRRHGRPALVCMLLIGAGCGDALEIEVSVTGMTNIASIEVVDAQVYSGEIGNEEGLSEQIEEAVLPVTISVPPGEYVVVAAQGTCSAQETVTLVDKNLAVELSLSCVE